MKEFTGIIRSGRLELSLTQLKQRQSYLASLKEDTRIIETLRIERKQKTWQQVKCHWGLVISTILYEFERNGWDTSILLNMPKPTGIKVSKGLLQEYLYAVCPEYNEAGEHITMSNKDWTIKNSCNFFEDVRNFAASQEWSIYIPEPDLNWRENEKE